MTELKLTVEEELLLEKMISERNKKKSQESLNNFKGGFEFIMVIFTFVMFMIITGYDIYVYSIAFFQSQSEILSSLLLGHLVIFGFFFTVYVKYFNDEGKGDSK